MEVTEKVNINDLYSRKKHLEVYVSDSQDSKKWETWSVYLVGLDGSPDCQVGHFGKNRFFRTRRGVNRTRYRTFGDLMCGIKLSAQKNGLKVVGYNIK